VSKSTLILKVGIKYSMCGVSVIICATSWNPMRSVFFSLRHKYFTWTACAGGFIPTRAYWLMCRPTCTYACIYAQCISI